MCNRAGIEALAAAPVKSVYVFIQRFVPLAVETLGALREEAATTFPGQWSLQCRRHWRAAIHSV